MNRKDKSFSRFGFIKKMLSPTVADMDDIGGEVQETIISPKGLYSKPVETDTVSLPMMDGETQTVIMPIQEFIDFLKDRDVILTDDKSYIHFKYVDGIIHVKADKVIVDAKDEFTVNTKKFTVNASDSIDFDGATINNNSVNTGDTHNHTGNLGYPTSSPI